jgi:two-component system, response regulator RegA
MTEQAVGTTTQPMGAGAGERAVTEGPILLLVDDDAPLRRSLQRAMERRGFMVYAAESLQAGLNLAHSIKPEYAVIDLRLEDGSGLELVRRVRELHPRVRIVILTGYGNIATAVTAVKLGAVDYLAKPADADDVTDALLAPSDDKAPPPENPMSADRVRWEHIQRVYELCNRNVSETARRLNMHRRTLQRILAKRAPK